MKRTKAERKAFRKKIGPWLKKASVGTVKGIVSVALDIPPGTKTLSKIATAGLTKAVPALKETQALEFIDERTSNVPLGQTMVTLKRAYEFVMDAIELWDEIKALVQEYRDELNPKD